MVVFRVALVLPVLMRRHPREVVSEPLPNLQPFRVGLHARRLENGRGPRDLHEVQRVDDPRSTSGDAAVYCLRVLQIRVHARGVGHEPGAQMGGRRGGEPLLVGHDPRGGERRHVHAEPDQRQTMRDEVVRVGHSVALNVGTARMVGIRPPVVAFGKVIVPPVTNAMRQK